MSLRCLIVDDEPLSRNVLEKFVTDVPWLEYAGSRADAFEAQDFLSNEQVDLLFLDINMPKMSGLSLVRSFSGTAPMVIFITAYPEFAVDGFDLDAVDFLTKPVSFERFVRAVNKAREWKEFRERETRNGLEHIFLKADKKLYKVNFSDIDLLEAYGDYVKVHTEERTIIVFERLKTLLAKLPAERFARAHKSYVIPLEKIEYIEGNQVRVGKRTVPLGAAYKEGILD
ncbi:DNA-binding response regulator [Fulvitalea axinellae]|uniref:DNA-binding response regulator n=1 Tax=Fulvitalea axinellae TaxID=1182444 RepID=A0AAU9CXD1_9BACT|nr:DNA-binding response regulator [Fulvitalea axinellae]